MLSERTIYNAECDDCGWDVESDDGEQRDEFIASLINDGWKIKDNSECICPECAKDIEVLDDGWDDE